MTPTEMMDSICKFGISDLVTMKVHTVVRNNAKTKPKAYVPALQPLQILERHIVQCHGGIQVYYLCRVHILTRYDHPAFGTEFVRVVEIELELYPQEDAAEKEPAEEHG